MIKYWVGGAGNWDGSSTSHWSLSSGGAGGAGVPGTSDDVVFDGNSGVGNVVAASAIDVKSIDFTGYTGTFSGSSNIQVRGDFKFYAGMTMTWTGNLSMIINAGILTSAGKSFGGTVSMSGTGGTNQLTDDLICAGQFTLSACTFNDNGHNITASNFVLSGNMNITIGAGVYTMTGTGGVSLGSGTITLSCSSSHLWKFTNTSNTLLIFDAGNNGSGVTFTWGSIWFDRAGSTAEIGIFGKNVFDDFKDTGTAAHALGFQRNSIGDQTTFNTWHVTGSAGNLIKIWTYNNQTDTHRLICASGIISSDYLNIQHSVVTGGADFYAGTHSTNNQAVATAGSGWQFTVPPLTVETDAVSAIKTTTATGNGDVIYPGPDAITERGIVWSLNPTPTISDNKVAVAGTSGSYSGAITSLTDNTLYYVRAYVTTGLGTTYGDQVTFTTRETIVITNPVTDIQRTTPKGHGNVADDGGETITERGLVWATHSDPTTADDKIVVAGTTGEFEGGLTGLADDTTYYVRAYAITAVAITYGDNVSFLSKSSLGRVGVLDTGFTDFEEPIYFELIDRWRSFTDMYAKSKAISGLNLYTENAAGTRVYFQNQKAPPNAWEDIGSIDEENNALFPNASTDDFDVGRIRLAGFTSGEPIVIHGIEILSINIKGFNRN